MHKKAFQIDSKKLRAQSIVINLYNNPLHKDNIMGIYYLMNINLPIVNKYFPLENQ